MPEAERTAIYRMYDEDGALLYIGVSRDFGHRWTQHARKQPWYDLVDRQTVEWRASRHEALTAETAAIKVERPKFNVVHSPLRESAPPVRRPPPPQADAEQDVERDEQERRLIEERAAEQRRVLKALGPNASMQEAAAAIAASAPLLTQEQREILRPLLAGTIPAEPVASPSAA
jgi:predicted GIY-YIG superfamily endonuclease